MECPFWKGIETIDRLSIVQDDEFEDHLDYYQHHSNALFDYPETPERFEKTKYFGNCRKCGSTMTMRPRQSSSGNMICVCANCFGCGSDNKESSPSVSNRAAYSSRESSEPGAPSDIGALPGKLCEG